jgi:hypothetical protein
MLHRFIATTFYSSFNASSALLLKKKRESSLNASSLLIFSKEIHHLMLFAVTFKSNFATSGTRL